MSSLAAMAYQPHLSDQMVTLHDRMLTLLRDDQPATMGPGLSRTAATVTGTTAVVILYLALTILLPGISATASSGCVGTFPA